MKNFAIGASLLMASACSQPALADAGSKSKETLYMFLTATGNVIAANYTGQ